MRFILECIGCTMMLFTYFFNSVNTFCIKKVLQLLSLNKFFCRNLDIDGLLFKEFFDKNKRKSFPAKRPPNNVEKTTHIRLLQY